jgi:cbb3-type cytochrome oxidase subunit 3
MKELFASAEIGLIGLVFFFSVFVLIAVWAYTPSRKQSIEALKYIPLKNEDDHGAA